MDTLKDIPEFFETTLDESIVARTENLGSFRELGPPDLVHITKANAKPGVKEVGSYHYVSGVDASSSATLAAYLNSLTYALEETHAWFSKSSSWRIRSGTYCCFNAFSRFDVRVEVKIPGGVESYVIDQRGDRHDATPEIWVETYISALLRAILYSDDVNYRLAGFRKLDPIPNVEAETHFLEAAEELFFKGWQLGSDPEIQVATAVSNHLTAGIMKYFSENYRFERAVNLFEKLYQKDPEVAALLAQSYLGMDDEIKVVNILYEALKQNSMSYALLHVQTDFLLSKGKVEWALKLAKQAVNCAPSEFVTWAKLTEVYIELTDYESALLTLNSCPMFTYNERDMHRMPSPAKSHLPIKSEIANGGLWDDESMRDNEADLALLRLPAPSLRGTFSKAYLLLTRLVDKIGWDELLKCRSSVFVMEEEYRIQKAAEEERTKKHRKHSSITEPKLNEEEDKSKAKMNGLHNRPSSPIPTITVSTDSENNADENRKEQNDADAAEAGLSEQDDKDLEDVPRNNESMEDVNLEDEKNLAQNDKDKDEGEEEKRNSGGMSDKFEKLDLERPSQAANEDFSDSQDQDDSSKDAVRKDYAFSFNNKRLCERWLDNLFMVLYEDLRVYTVWRSEVAHYRNQNIGYRKTGTEWEILGDLASRLHHKDEAMDAYQRCLEHKFSAKAWLRLLETFADEGDVQQALGAVVKLAIYCERWYHEIIYPTAIAHNINKLICQHGLSKLRYTLVSMNLSSAVNKLVERYFTYAETFKTPGHEI